MKENQRPESRRKSADGDSHRRITFLSSDQQTEIAVVSQDGLKRWPPHEGKVAVLRLRPEPNTRIRLLEDGRVEVVFRHSEVIGLLYALNACERDGFIYTLPPKITHKSASRRRYWHLKNEERVRRLRRG